MTVNPDVALPAGVYRHYKGPLYLVLGLAHDANAEELYRLREMHNEWFPLGEREVVVYIGLQTDEAHEGARLAVRTLQDFFAWVHARHSPQPFGSQCRHFAVVSDTGPWCHCGETPNSYIQKRFSYVGPRYVAGMGG